MKPILQTSRLILRELTPEDALHFYDLNLNPNVIKYTGDLPFESIEEARKFLENYNPYQTYGYGRWAVLDNKSHEFLGWCGLKYEEGITDLGFRFFEENWGKGYATESALACLNYGFKELNLEKIIGRAMKENLASIKVLEKIGMQYKGEMECSTHPGVLYQIEKSEFLGK